MKLFLPIVVFGDGRYTKIFVDKGIIMRGNEERHQFVLQVSDDMIDTKLLSETEVLRGTLRSVGALKKGEPQAETPIQYIVRDYNTLDIWRFDNPKMYLCLMNMNQQETTLSKWIELGMVDEIKRLKEQLYAYKFWNKKLMYDNDQLVSKLPEWVKDTISLTQQVGQKGTPSSDEPSEETT